MASDVEQQHAPTDVADPRPPLPPAGDARRDLTERSRERILRTALEEFATRGFDGTTTAAVARRAGVTQPLVHYHFTSKLALWQAAVQEAFAASAEAFAGVDRELIGLEPLDQLKVLTRRYVRFSARYPELARIVSYESMQGGERLRWLNDHAVDARFDWFRYRYEQGVEEGWLKPLPALHVLSSIGACGAYLFMIRASMWETHRIDVLDPEVVELHADTVIEMLFHGITQEVPA